MGKPYPVELRERVVWRVLAGHSHRSVAKHFKVSSRFINRMMLFYKATKDVTPPKQGRPVSGRYRVYEGFIKSQIKSKGELTLRELYTLVQTHYGKHVCQSGMWYALQSWGLSFKKNAASK